MLDDQYHKIEADKVKAIEWLEAWLRHKTIRRAIDRLKIRTGGLEPVVRLTDGVLLHEIIAVMFAYTMSEPEDFIDLLWEFGKYSVLEGEDRNG